MFYSNVMYQIAAALILLIIIINYIKMPKLPILSTKFFSCMLIFTGVYLIADISTVYTITHMDIVPMWINRLCHQIFIGTLITVIVCFFLYVLLLGRQQKRLNGLYWVGVLTPYGVAILTVILGKLEYFNDGIRVYSYGIMANMVYVVVCVYIVASNIVIVKHKENYKPEVKNAVHTGSIIWVVAALPRNII